MVQNETRPVSGYTDLHCKLYLSFFYRIKRILRPKFQMKEKSRIFQTGYCVKNPEKQNQKTKQNKTSIIQIGCMLKPPDCMLK